VWETLVNYLEQAINIEEIPHHNSIEGYQMALIYTSVLYSEIDIEHSIELSLQVLEIKREIGDPDSLTVLSNLSYFYQDSNIEEAHRYAKMVLDMRKHIVPVDSNALRISHLRLAAVLCRMGNYEEAIDHSLEARFLAKKLFGENSEEYARSTQNTGVYYSKKGDADMAIEFAKQAYNNPSGDKQITAGNLAAEYNSVDVDSCYKYVKEAWQLFREEYLLNLNSLSLINRFSYVSTEKNWVYGLLPIGYFLQHEDYDDFKKLAFDCILFSKNIKLDCNKSEEELSRLLNLNVDTIRAYLGENDVVINCWSDNYSGHNFGEDSIIVAILKKSQEVPIFVKLSKERIYKTLSGEETMKENYFPLYDNIWKEIIEKGEIKEGNRLFVSLDNILSQTPIELICNYDWQYVGDKYEIIRVSSASLIPQINQREEFISAALYGGLEYELKPETQDNYILSACNRSFADINMYKEVGDSLITVLRSQSEYLPWTKIEIDSIMQILLNSSIKSLQVYQNNKGTEESFKLLSGNAPSIIHISTHGFCVHPKEKMSWFDYYNYCMDHSGLLMSGVFTTDIINKDSELVEDGFLKSKEIASLDLSHTDLVILSACKTGLGGMTPFGIVGLQDAFKAAGVKSLLLTLDDVDDAATSFFMIHFYQYLISGCTKREALKKSQQILRESELFNSFHYWGNFILID